MKRLSAAALLLTAAFSVLLGGGFPLLPAQEAAQNTPPPGSKPRDFNTLTPEEQERFRREFTVSWTTGPDGLPSGPEEFNKARDEIVNHAEPLTYDEFFEITGRHDLTMLESSELWRLMAERQNPPISIDELKTLYERKRDSIKTFYAVFRDGDETVTFALKGSDRLYLEKEDKSIVNEDDATPVSAYRTIHARNPSDHRVVSFYAEESGKKFSTAQRTPLSGFSALQCYNPNIPLAPARLVNSKQCFQNTDSSSDMTKLLELHPVCLFGKPEMIDGHRCLLLAERDTKIYLDADRDYSIYAVFHHGRLKESEWGGYMPSHTTEPTSKKVLHGLKDYGDGVWLPSRVETVSYAEDGSVKSEKEIVYDKIKVNRRIRDSFFEDVIPDDAYVTDVTDKSDVKTYKWRDRNLLDIPARDRPAVRHQCVYRSICVAIGLVLIVVGAFAKWRKRRLAGGQA